MSTILVHPQTLQVALNEAAYLHTPQVTLREGQLLHQVPWHPGYQPLDLRSYSRGCGSGAQYQFLREYQPRFQCPVLRADVLPVKESVDAQYQRYPQDGVPQVVHFEYVLTYSTEPPQS